CNLHIEDQKTDHFLETIQGLQADMTHGEDHPSPQQHSGCLRAWRCLLQPALTTLTTAWGKLWLPWGGGEDRDQVWRLLFIGPLSQTTKPRSHICQKVWFDKYRCVLCLAPPF
ncbi:mCG140596, partial [Mus musculus]